MGECWGPQTGLGGVVEREAESHLWSNLFSVWKSPLHFVLISKGLFSSLKKKNLSVPTFKRFPVFFFLAYSSFHPNVQKYQGSWQGHSDDIKSRKRRKGRAFPSGGVLVATGLWTLSLSRYSSLRGPRSAWGKTPDLRKDRPEGHCIFHVTPQGGESAH